MKKIVLAWIFICMFSCSLLPPASASAAEDAVISNSLNIATMDNRPLTIDRLVCMAFNDIRYEALNMSAASAQISHELANSGERDGVISSVPNVEQLYPHLKKVPVVLDYTNIWAFAREGSGVEINKWDDLSGRRVGLLIVGFYPISRVPADALSITKKETTKQLMEGLIQNEYDVVVLTQRSSESLAIPSSIKNVGMIEQLTDTLYLHERNEYLIPLITESLENLFKDGRGEKILNNIPMPEMYPKKTVLQIISTNTEITREDQFRGIISDYFQDDPSIEWYSIALNSGRFSDDSQRLSYFANLLRRDCAARNIAAIVVSGEEAFDFLKEYYNLFFRNTPVLFYGITDGYETSVQGFEQYFTGIVEELSAYETVSEALNFFKETHTVYVVNDYTAEGSSYRANIEKQLEPFAERLHIEYNENISRDEMLEQIRALPQHSIVLVGSYFCDGDGQYYPLNEMKRTLEYGSLVPVFSLYSTDLAYGAIGGKCPNYEKYGEALSGMIQQVVDGESVTDIPVVTDSEKYNQWVFDNAVMGSWGIKEKSLPAGSLIINKTLSVWETNPALAFGMLFFTAASLIIIIALFIFSRKLRRKNLDLLEMKEHLHTAGELLEKDNKIKEVKERLEKIINTSPIAYMLTINGEVIELNETMKNDAGLNVGDITLPIHTDVPRYKEILERTLEEKTVKNEIVKIKLANGEVHRSIANLSTVEYDGKQAVAVWAVDIEESEKQKDELIASQQETKEVKDRLERILQTAPIPFAIFDDGRVIEINNAMKASTGIDIGSDVRDIYANPSQHDDVINRLSQGIAIENEFASFYFRDGKVHRCILNACPAEYENRMTVILWAVDIEDSERQKDELIDLQQETKEVKERLERIINTSPIAFLMHVNYKVVEINKTLAERSGLRVGDDIVPAYAYREQFDDIVQRFDKNKLMVNESATFKLANGEAQRCLMSLSSVEYNGQEAVAAWIVSIEESERQKDELIASKQLLNETMERMERTIRTAPVSYELLIDEKVVELNEIMEREMGLKIGDNVREWYASDDDRNLLLERILREQRLTNEIVRLRTANGEFHRCLINAVITEYQEKPAMVVWSVDIEEMERKNDQLLVAQKDLQTVLDTMPIPVRILDLETKKIVYLNKSCLDLFELDSYEQGYSQALHDTLPEVQSDGMPSSEKVEIMIRTEGPFALEVEYITAKGNIIDALLTACHINFNGHRSSVGIIRDLAQERREAELRSAALAAEESSRAKTTFLANMSHEIRTPMNGIIGMTDLLMAEELSGRQLRYVGDIKTSAESLLGIINDILDLSKISENKLQISPVHIDLSTLLKNTVSMMRFSAESNGIDFYDDIKISSPEYVLADDVRLKQVIVNLLSNAIKFTNEGFVKLTVKIEEGNIMFEISDTGLGIRQEDTELIFQAFGQADARKNRAIKGTGLGLSITKNLVELMGGKVWVESEYGKGSTFHVVIPYIPGDESAVEAPDMEFKYIFAPAAQILLVDDIQTNLTVGSGLLRLCGITADMAMSGREAIELVKSKEYDLVFMDHMMPEMDGIEAMKVIRSMGDKYALLPIIALTANAVNESKELLLSSGMNAFLSKPIDKTELVNILKQWLPPEKIETDAKSAGTEQSVPYSDVLSAASKIDGLDVEMALGRISGMQDILEASLRQVANSIDGQIRKMDDCLANRDLRGFSIEAHGLKGALANIGAMHNSELSAELEIASKAENMTLCEKNFAIFASTMESFAAELGAIFSTAEIKSNPQGDKGFLSLKINEAIEYLDNFEGADALGCLRELEEFTFGVEEDAMLNDARNLIEAFDHDNAVTLLKSIFNLKSRNNTTI